LRFLMRFLKATQKLEASGHLALKHGFWFLVCRNPEQLAHEGRRHFIWSRSIFGTG
jgi:hypothetical protein